MSMEFIRKLPIPQETKEKYPLTDEARLAKEANDLEIKNIFDGNSEKLLLIIGPCSADSEEPVMEYIYRLKKVSDQVKDKLFILPRIYTNKPRTDANGYKGMLHQPDPDNPPDVYNGVLASRHLHLRVITETHLPTSDELLYPANYRYNSDLLSYVAVGARSVEDQEHRMVASGIEVPVGMKNPTGGDISVMMNSVTAAQSPHSFIYRGWEVKTTGNPYAHTILRGYVSKQGHTVPNYHYEDLSHLAETYMRHPNLTHPAVIVDTNHSNSGKRFEEQPRICKEVLHSMRHSSDIKNLVRGFMIESYLMDGSQKIGDGLFGCSITDPCLGWEKTEKLIFEIADLV